MHRRRSILVATFAVAAFVGSAPAATLTTLYNFPLSNANPRGGVVLDDVGNLYGSTAFGSTGNGGIYRLAPNGTFTSVADLAYDNGRSILSPLTRDAAGNFYGTAFSGGTNNLGTVFKVTPGGTITTLATFDGTNGANPAGRVVFGPDGNLYGTTRNGGAVDRGVVFKLTLGGTLTTVTAFQGETTLYPLAGVTFDGAGNLYGTTADSSQRDAANYYQGSVFKIAANGAFSTVYKFADFNSGVAPTADLLLGADGNLYGTASEGGVNGQGTIFKLTTEGSYTKLAEFNGLNGAFPRAGLIADAAGNLYGTTAGSGSNCGSVFKLAADGTLTTLWKFQDDGNGAFPTGPLVADAAGNLYGTTGFRMGITGPDTYGTVFKIADAGFVVPEPATLSLLVAGATLAMRRRRR